MLNAKNEAGNRPVVPAGSHAARCYGVIDLGTQYSEKFGVWSRKVQLQFELPNDLMDDGRPLAISKKYTLSLNDKANLKKDLESWLGRGITEDEEKNGFALGNMLGAPCLLSVIHAQSGDKTYANIAAVMSVPKGMVVPDQSNPIISYDVENGRDAVYDKLPDWIKNIIEESREFAGEASAVEAEEPAVEAEEPAVEAEEPAVEAGAPFDIPITPEQLSEMERLYRSKKIDPNVFTATYLTPYGAAKPKDLTEYDALLVIAALEAV